MLLSDDFEAFPDLGVGLVGGRVVEHLEEEIAGKVASAVGLALRLTKRVEDTLKDSGGGGVVVVRRVNPSDGGVVLEVGVGVCAADSLSEGGFLG